MWLPRPPRIVRRLRAAMVRCPESCGADESVAVYRDRSFADGLISPDQARIAEALPGLLRADSRLLHVGVGCSDLARRFAGIVAQIDGITVLEDERAAAESLGLPNYRVWVMNKHGSSFRSLSGPYDLIVDNNPGSFACCSRHFFATMQHYSDLLSRGGRVLTEARGAGWRQPGGISLRWRHWDRLGRGLGLVPEVIDGTVWGWRRG